MSAHDPVRDDPVMSKLRRMKPHHMTVELADGGERKVQVPTTGNKWQRLANLIDPMEWEAITAYDKDDNCLGVVENLHEGDDEGDDEDDRADDDRDERMAKLIAGVVDKTLARAEAMFKSQLDANATIVKNVADSNRLLAESFRTAMSATAASDLARRTSAGDDGGTPEMASMVQTFLMMMAAGGNGGGLGNIAAMFGGGSKPEPKPSKVIEATAKKEG